MTLKQFKTLRVGDRILVREDLHLRTYGNDSFVHEMIPTIGKVIKVESILLEHNKIMYNDYYYTPEMIKSKAFLFGR